MKTRMFVMSRKGLAIGLVLGCVIALGIGKTEAGELPLKGSISGSSVNTQSDTNGDGQKGYLSRGGYKGTDGSATFQHAAETVFAGPAICPNGNPGVSFTLLQGTGHEVVRLDSTGDLIVFEVTSETQCFDSSTGIFFINGTQNATGGTGRFDGASGSATYSVTARILFQDEAGNFFSEFSGTIEATISTP